MSSSADKYPEFFQVYLPEHSSESLRIPDAFLEYLGHKIPKKIVLRTHDENIWSVETLETDNGLFFQKGWLKLVSNNSLQVGDILVFKYNGHVMFDLLILGNTGCEKEQVGTSPSNRHTMQQDNQLPTQQQEEEEVEEEAYEMRDRDQAGSSSRRRILEGRGENYSVTGYKPGKLEEGIEEFLPSNNPYFITRLRKTRASELAIPYEIRKDFKLKFSDSIQLQDPEGRFWQGNVIKWKDGRVWVRCGWKKLCRWNKVAMDDNLICEFLPTQKRTQEIIKVQIIRSKMRKGQSAN